MHWCVSTQLSFHPEAHLPQQRHVVIQCGDDEVRDLEVDVLRFQNLQCFQHRCKLPAAQVLIECVRKPFQIDISRVQDPAKASEWTAIDETVRVDDAQ